MKIAAIALITSLLTPGGVFDVLDTLFSLAQPMQQEQVVNVPSEQYSREQFGKGWAKENGCDMRNIILRERLDNVKIGSNGCRVETGTFTDAYNGEYTQFKRQGNRTDIDHVVPLKQAWDNGAKYWTQEQREQFANDRDNLEPVSAKDNRAKGASSPSEWLPEVNQCDYTNRYISVSEKYGLNVSQNVYSVRDKVC